MGRRAWIWSLVALSSVGCSGLSAFGPSLSGGADSSDAEPSDAPSVYGDTGLIWEGDVDVSEPQEAPPWAVHDGVYTGTFTLTIQMPGIPIPMGTCTGQMSFDVAWDAEPQIASDIDCAWGLLIAYGPVVGNLTGAFVGDNEAEGLIDAYVERTEGELPLSVYANWKATFANGRMKLEYADRSSRDMVKIGAFDGTRR